MLRAFKEIIAETVCFTITIIVIYENHNSTMNPNKTNVFVKWHLIQICIPFKK